MTLDPRGYEGGLLTSMTSGPRVHARVGGGRRARGQNLVHLQNMVFLSKSRGSYLDSHLSESIHTWTMGTL